MRFPDITGYRLSQPLQLALMEGAYTSRSVIAEAQRCINLYPEHNPQDAPFPTTHYPTPGLSLWSAAPITNGTCAGRGTYRSTRGPGGTGGQLFTVVGPTLYFVNSSGQWQAIGNLETQTGPVGFIDNGDVIVVVDGLSNLQIGLAPCITIDTVPPLPAGTPIPYSWYTMGNALALPNATYPSRIGTLEFAVNIAPTSTGSIVNVVLDPAPSGTTASGTGYMVQFNSENGQQSGQLFVLTIVGSTYTATPIGTFSQAANTAALPSGIHSVSCSIGLNGAYNTFQLWIDGQLQCTAQDATYSGFGQTFFGAPNATTVSTIGAVRMIDPAVYCVNMVNFDFIKVTNPAIYGATHVDYVDTFFVLNQPNSQAFYISTSNLAFIDLTQGPITGTTLTAGGSNYANGTLAYQPLTGGTGTGAMATLTVVGGVVTAAVLSNPGNGYTVGDVLGSAIAPAPVPGALTGITLRGGGATLVAGTYTNMALTGGTGTGATATITCTYNGVTSYTLTANGTGYTQGDVLYAPIPVDTTNQGPQNYYFVPSFIASVASGPAGSGLQITVTSISLQNAVNALNIANKTGFADLLVGLMVVHREIWLFGRQTTEVWVDTGAPDFPFGLEGGIFIQRGLLAPYSLCKSDLTPLWLGADQNGHVMAFMGAQYNAQRISTHAMEVEWQSYPGVGDAVAFTYQQQGHTFWVINFPQADRTWVFDLATGLWHQRGTIDANGTIHRYLAQSYVNIYGADLVQRFDNGDLLTLDPTIYNELGNDVTRIRSFPHIKHEMRRMVYNHFTADMEVGNPET